VSTDQGGPPQLSFRFPWGSAERPHLIGYTLHVFPRRPPAIPANSADEHLDHIAAVPNDMFRIPGTRIRFGLDFLIGWVPGIGDALAGIASLVIIVAAW
jgi:hypothetical protein